MLRDVFYYGKKPNVHPREQYAENLADARAKATTEHFWIINEFCDYRNFDWDFDFEFLPDEDVWAEEHNNVWPSQHQKDSGTWLCPKEHSDVIVYRGDVDPVKHKNEKSDRWVELDLIDPNKFDFSWHPDPTDPPYIYKWGCKFYPAQLKHVLEYHVPGATQEKYMTTTVELLPQTERWIEFQEVDKTKFDMSWRPDPLDPPFIYVWGNKYIDGKLRSTIEYRVPGATEKKYMTLHVPVLPEWDKWVEVQPVDKDKFDFSWRPDPREPPYIYTWGNKYIEAEYRPTLEYHAEGATDRKYMDEHVPVLPEWNRWKILQNIDMASFDFMWRPDPKEPPFTYVFGNELYDAIRMPTVVYTMPHGDEIKYLDTPRAKLANDPSKYEHLEDSYLQDYSWLPDPYSPPYIYVWGNQWNRPEDKISVQYIVEGATQYKYMEERAIRKPCMDNWFIPENLDVSNFDFSWEPNPKDKPYIYEFGTQWQQTGGPQYIVPGATEKKYVDVQKAIKLPSRENWKILGNIDTSGFDFSWHPDSNSPPYVYVFGNQWNNATDQPTVEYHAPDATQVKYIDDIVAKLKPDTTNWIIPDNIDTSDFDFSWLPNPHSPPYIYEFGTQWQKTGGPRYVVENATTVKYVDFQKAKILPDNTNFKAMKGMKVKSFDYSWHPDSTEEPYIYVFGNQWFNAEKEPTIEYRVPGATQVKYVHDIIVTLDQDMTNWEVPESIEISSFDFSWHPDPDSPPYIYQFGTQHQKTGGPRYIANGAKIDSPVKYVDNFKATRLPTKANWKIVDDINVEDFDYSWHPDDTEPPYIYIFGNTQYTAEEMPTLQYIVDGATELKYVNELAAKLGKNMKNWIVPGNVDITQFDFSWVPHPKAPPYIYEFATEWNNRGGPRYIVSGATEFEYIEDVKAKLLSSKENWEVDSNVDVTLFDFSWVPHPEAPAYIYQFGTILDKNDGPRYVTPNNNGEIVYLERIEFEGTNELPVNRYYIETSLEDLINEHPDELFWAMRKNINYDDFDFNWRPNIEQSHYVHAFGSSDSELTQTYLVNATQWLKGNRDFNWVENVELTEESLAEIFVKPDMFYVDRGNSESLSRFNILKDKFGDKIQKTRYLNSWVETINRCTNKATTDVFWVLNSELDYTDFNFDYYPNPWQMKMVHVFGTQWSHWGTTFIVNRETFREDTKYIKIIEHLSNLNFVKDIRAKATKCVHDIIVIDHGNKELETVVSQLQNKAPDRTITVIPYMDSYLETFGEIINRQQVKKEHYIWVCSSVCDYSSFDFSYVCDPFARDQLHVFPSGTQKFGDTFFVDVNKAREVISDLESLERFNKVNYNSTIKAERLPEPVIIIDDDTHATAIDKITDFPYATLITSDNVDIDKVDVEPMNLWYNETKNIYVTSTGATRIIAPKEVKDYVKKELYEYPYIKRAPKLASSKPLDIVFLSNGETGADENYEHLLNVTKGLPNRVVRVDGVNGRAAAYHAAAEASETPWMFTVFAKLNVNPKFDWNWQPDRMQCPKHYIFYAKNPVNGLIYGHQAMIAYNKKLTLANEGKGLDFTLDDEHEVVPLISGTAQYNTDEFSTWRTAFREVIKLKADTTDVAKDRLDAWLNKAEGNFAQYSIKGALDAEKYYDEVNGDFDMLKLSYEWDWLRKKFNEM